MNWHRVALSQVAEVFNGKTPSKAEKRSSGYPVLKIKDVDELGNFIGVFDSFVDDIFLEKFSSKRIRAGDTLILNAAHNADYVGSKSYFADKQVESAISTGEWLIVRSNPDMLDSRFKHYFLQSAPAKNAIHEMVKGIHLYPRDVSRLEIPLPPLPVQNKISAILEKADQARRKRQAALRLTDQFLQSAFLDLFGDPVNNTKKWKITLLGEITDCLDNQRIPVTKTDRKPGPYPYYGASGIVDWVDKFIFDEPLLLLAEDGENLRSRVKPVAFCIDGKTWVNNHAHVLRCRDVDRYFLKMILNRMDYSPYFAGATRPKITKSTMEDFKTICPPLNMQRKFAALVEKTETFCKKQRQSEQELETLFQSLIQKAFKGEFACS